VDKILIPEYRVCCHVGVQKEERDVAQDVLIDLQLELDLSQAGRADDFSLTVDYEEVCRTVATTVERRPRKLIETIAEEIAEVLLANYPLQAVTVQVRKPGALAHRGIPYAAVVVERHG
jgi:dihydroneopterin aldolase